MIRPDAVCLYRALVVVIEADDFNGHSGGGDYTISRFGTPWTHNRALNAELAQAKDVARVLSERYGKGSFFFELIPMPCL